MYLEDLTVKCVSYVCLCGCCGGIFFFSFNVGKKNYNTASALAVCVVCTLEATVVFGQVKSVCIRDGG